MSRMGGSMERKLCACGNLTMSKGKDKHGNTKYGSRCHTCRELGRRSKKDHCELCGFVALDPVQLDVDHIDRNPSNNNPDNLQTLCANCHRLKTKKNKDWRQNEKV
jgi:5-methylcytosine-specific restriction endonuclease McrA